MKHFICISECTYVNCTFDSVHRVFIDTLLCILSQVCFIFLNCILIIITILIIGDKNNLKLLTQMPPTFFYLQYILCITLVLIVFDITNRINMHMWFYMNKNLKIAYLTLQNTISITLFSLWSKYT